MHGVKPAQVLRATHLSTALDCYACVQRLPLAISKLEMQPCLTRDTTGLHCKVLTKDVAHCAASTSRAGKPFLLEGQACVQCTGFQMLTCMLFDVHNLPHTSSLSMCRQAPTLLITHSSKYATIFQECLANTLCFTNIFAALSAQCSDILGSNALRAVSLQYHMKHLPHASQLTATDPTVSPSLCCKRHPMFAAYCTTHAPQCTCSLLIASIGIRNADNCEVPPSTPRQSSHSDSAFTVKYLSELFTTWARRSGRRLSQ